MRDGGRFGPLTERPFRLLWLGRTCSAIGDSLIPVALAFAVLRIGGGASGLGIVLAAATIGRASFTVAGGVWADRLPRRAVMLTADLVRVGTQATTAALLFGHAAQVWELALLQGLAGAAGGFFNPASTALLPQAVSAPRLQQANALVSLSQSAAYIFGPAASGAIVAVAGAGWVFAIDAASFLVSAAFLSALHVEAHVRPRAQRFWHEVRDGWQEVRRHGWLTSGFLGFALGNVGIGLYLVLGPLVSRQHLGGAKAWGLILTAGAIGGVVGGLVGYRVRPRHPSRRGIRDLGIWRRPSVHARATATGSRDHGGERSPRHHHHHRKHPVGDGVTTGGPAGPPRSGQLVRLAPFAVPDARRSGAGRPAVERARRSHDPRARRRADVRAESVRARVCPRGPQLAAARRAELCAR